MQKEVELFDKKFVHFMWDGKLEGKKCFVSDSIDVLMEAVNEGTFHTAVINRSVGGGYGLHSDETGCDYNYAYYDPNYEAKRAYYKEGKAIQFKKKDCSAGWLDSVAPEWLDCNEYRAKPKEENVTPTWANVENCKKCVHVAKSTMQEPCNKCFKRSMFERKEKRYRPYESSAEMIADFIARFKVDCPSYCEPLVWIKGKWTDNRYLVLAFRENAIKFSDDDEPLEFEPLFNSYTYLDGSPCGMEVKE